MERRKFVRIPVELEARYWLPEESPFNCRLALSGDISERGLRLYVTERLVIGQEIHFTLRQRSGGTWSPTISGIIAWHNEDASVKHTSKSSSGSAGVSFSDVTPTIGNRIATLLEEQSVKTTPEGFNLEHLLDTRPTIELVRSAYDGSTATYRVLRAFGWGPLNNLGYFQFPSPFGVLNLLLSFLLFKTSFLLPEAQMRLVRKSARLLRVRGGDRVLDIACGRGKGPFIIASLNPKSWITGIDLLPENTQVASILYGNAGNLRFLIGDATDLEFEDKSFNKILCLEAAFHFTDREQFLKEAYRVLDEEGQLVVVDFAWKTDTDRVINADDEKTRLVRGIWKWEDFFSVEQYIKAAKSIGFEIERFHDWSPWVMQPMEFTFRVVAWLGCRRWGHFLLLHLNPLLHKMADDEWIDIRQSAKAHQYVCKYIKYIAFVLKKPQTQYLYSKTKSPPESFGMSALG